jgi:hypothetical protein
MSHQQHVSILGAIYLILGILNLLLAVILFAAIGAQVMLSADARAVIRYDDLGRAAVACVG